MGEIIFLAVLFAASGLYLIETFGYKVLDFDVSGGPAVYPQIILAIFMVLIVVRIIQILIRKEKGKFVFLELFTDVRGFIFFSFLLYVILIKPIGYLIITPVFLITDILYLYYKKMEKPCTVKQTAICIIISLAFTIGLYLFFYSMLNVQLPKGLLAEIL